MTLVYALVSRPPARITTRGVAGERLRAIRIGGLAAIVGDVTRPPASAVRNLTRYAAVIDTLADAVPAILPARYGTIVRDTAELASILRARGVSLRQRLRAVRGRVQMTIRTVAIQAPATTRPRSGTEYLRQRMVTAPALEPIRVAVRKYVNESRIERHGDVVTVHDLISQRAVERYRTAVEQAATEHQARLMLSGPRPPYAFTEE